MMKRRKRQIERRKRKFLQKRLRKHYICGSEWNVCLMGGGQYENVIPQNRTVIRDCISLSHTHTHTHTHREREREKERKRERETLTHIYIYIYSPSPYS